MTVSVKKIFDRNIFLLGELDKAIYYFREQQHDKALGIIADSMDLIKETIEDIASDREYFNPVSMDSVLEMLHSVLEAYKKENYVLLADLFEMQMVSFLCKIQELIISREEIIFEEEEYLNNINLLKENSSGLSGLSIHSIDPGLLLKEGYRVEFTSCGLMTLAAENKNTQFYFHTNGRVQSEAFILAKHWHKKGIKQYNIYGLGFGYHIKELLSLSEQARIDIYEADLNVILLACAFTKLSDIFKCGRVKLIFDPDYRKLSERIRDMSKEEIFYVHYPSFQNIRSEEGRKITKNYVSWSKTG